jgi:hypothetical protein
MYNLYIKMYLTNIYSKVYFPLKARLIKLNDLFAMTALSCF